MDLWFNFVVYGFQDEIRLIDCKTEPYHPRCPYCHCSIYLGLGEPLDYWMLFKSGANEINCPDSVVPWIFAFTTRQRSCGKVLFSFIYVCQFTGRIHMWPLSMMPLVSRRSHRKPPDLFKPVHLGTLPETYSILFTWVPTLLLKLCSGNLYQVKLVFIDKRNKNQYFL